MFTFSFYNQKKGNVYHRKKFYLKVIYRKSQFLLRTFSFCVGDIFFTCLF